MAEESRQNHSVNRFKFMRHGALLFCAVISSGLAQNTAVKNSIEDQYVPVLSGSQQIRGLLGDRLGVNAQKRLMESIDTDVILAGFRNRPGQQVWIGEHAGKFIDAATNTWLYNRDEALRKKLDAAVAGLLETQLPDGYLGTYREEDRFIDYGDNPPEPTTALPLWDVWAHKYDLIGLLNYYRHTGYEPALAASRRIGDLLYRTYGEGPGQQSIVRNDWHVGMANTSVLEPMVSLYRITGDPRYLEFCRYIVRAWDEPKGPGIVSTLLSKGKVRDVANAKAYEMMSNFVGLLDLYRVTGERAYLEPVLIAWKDIKEKRLYITGATSWGELFRGDHLLRADGRVGEGCVTVTWMQINLELLRLTGEAQYADELERSIYNALLGAQHPENGQICYFLPLNGAKQYGAVSHGIPEVSCCSSSVARGLALIPEVVWGLRHNGIAINLYTPGTARLSVAGGEVTLTSTTRFPASGEVELALKTSQPARFPLYLRVPEWCGDFTASVDGQSWRGTRGSYLEIDRTWGSADKVRIRMDLTTQVISGGPTYPDMAAIQRGPLVLAADTGLNPDADIWIAGVASEDAKALEIRETGITAPRWNGSLAYEVSGYTGNAALGKKPVKLVLVPVMDAGQSGADYRVWLQRP